MPRKEPRALVANAADEEQLKAAKRIEKDERTLELDDLYTILSAPEGRRFYIRMLREFGLLKTPFSPLGDRQTYVAIGFADAARWLIAEAQHAHPAALVTLLTEYNARISA